MNLDISLSKYKLVGKTTEYWSNAEPARRINIYEVEISDETKGLNENTTILTIWKDVDSEDIYDIHVGNPRSPEKIERDRLEWLEGYEIIERCE